jgi:TRAP-type C4-dicarboxylate transport system permease small subunit
VDQSTLTAFCDALICPLRITEPFTSSFHVFTSSTSCMRIHHRLLAASNAVNHGVERLLLAVGVVISLILFAQVVARYSGHSLSWSEEVGRYLLVATTFLGATVAYKRAHFIGLAGFGARLGLVVERLITRSLQTLTLACFGLITWYGVIYTLKSWEQTSTAVQMPMSLPIAVLPLSGLIFLLHILTDMTRHPAGAAAQATADTEDAAP